VIPKITDTIDNLNGLISFLKSETHYRDIHLLAYHKSGDGKYAALNMKNKMAQIEPPTTKTIEIIKEQFRSNGFNVTIGG
jgi:pyruvate formate lyase activating enzyme